MKKLFSTILICILFVTINGCIREAENKSKAGALAKKDIKIIDESGLKELINNKKGKIVFINVWATWCKPCVEEFPDIVKLYEENKRSGVEFLSLTVDLPSEIESKVIPFLKEQNANFPVYIADEKRSEGIIELLNPEWNGAIPATFIYDETGKQQVYLLGATNFKTFKENIDRVKNL
jgi:thiol-disulfide isomerase/thioredoxin